MSAASAHNFRRAAVAAVCGAFFAGCTARDAAPQEAAPPTNVILITLDTVRADHLGCYGYTRPTSPRIDAFAAGATLYTRMFSAAPWTVPAHASLFTGKYAFEHGARNFPVDKPVNNVNPLDERHLTLAEALKAEGYATGAFVANHAYLDRRWGMDQGFDYYYVERCYADALNRNVIDWLDKTADKPFFLFINYIDAHWPYNTAPQTGFADRRLSEQESKRLLSTLRDGILPGLAPPPEAEVREFMNQYDLAIANLDQNVGALLEHVRGAGLLDRTTIVITADHGEYFGEHLLIGHSKDIYQEVLWTPLIIRRPGQRAGERSDALVSSTDIAGMIVSGLSPAIGQRLSAAFRDRPGNHEVIAESYYTLIKDLFHPRWGQRFNRVRTAIFDWPYKYIDSSDGQNELYQLLDDPREKANLIASRADVATKLKKRLNDFKSGRAASTDTLKETTLDEEAVNKLKSLGYVDN